MFGQQRSQSSGPGLSINTGTANTFGSGSNNVTQPQSGGFLSTKQGGLFGASSAATSSAPSQAGTLFGGSALAAVSTAPFGGGLFSSTATSKSQTSLFGNPTTSQPESLDLFGNTAASQPQNNMFGGSLTSQPQQTSGLFGASMAQPQQNTGLFGATNTQGQQGGGAFGSSLFGQNQQGQQQQNNNNSVGGATQQQSLFGGSQNTQQMPFQQSRISTLNPPQQTQRSVFSASIGQYTAAQQTVPGVRIDLSNLKPTTRFNDLHEGLQKEIESIDAFILKQMELQAECESVLPSVGERITHLPGDVKYCARKLDAYERALENDAAAIDSARDLVKSEVEDARLSFKAIHSLRVPAQFHRSSSWNAAAVNAPKSLSAEDDKSADLVSYFSKQADDMGRKLSGLTKSLREVESYLSSLEGHQSAQVQAARMSHGRDGGVRSADEQIRELASVLRDFEGGILGVAGKVGAAREGVQELILGEGWNNRRGRG